MFSFVVISHAINTDLIRDCSIYVWMWIETNKEQLKATGSILSPLAIFMGSVVVQYAINKDNQKIKEKDFLNEQKRIESQNELTKYTTKQNQELTELIAQRDRDSALERLRIEILSSYLDRMTLLLKEIQSSEKETRATLGQIAKALTISTLKELDAKRNKIVTIFLYETELVQDSDNLFDNELNILYEANLENANLGSSFFKNANLKNANLSNADLENANLENANLENANLENANLKNANLKNANLRNSSLINSNLNNTIFDGTNLNKSDLRGANLSNARLHNVNLENAKLAFCNLFQAQIINSILVNVNFRKASLINVIIKNTNLSNAFFKYANLSLCKITDVNLSDANLRLVVFKDELKIAKESKTIPITLSKNMAMEMEMEITNQEVIVRGKGRLKNVDLRGSYLGSADFRGAIFEQVDWRGVKFFDIDIPIFAKDFDLSKVEEVRAKESEIRKPPVL